MDAFRVLDPGPLTTVQDLGRYGYQEYGVPVSGVLDPFAARVANLLVGNPDGAAVLETTYMGPRLEVLSQAWVAVTGADMPVLLNGEPRERWQAFRVNPGDLLVIRQAMAGLRGYLAVTGGIDVPLVMGSRATFPGGRLGGLDGRALAKGDLLPRGDGPMRPHPVSLPEALRPVHSREILLRAVPGPQDDHFAEGLERFFSAAFRVSPQADRMGYRLEGPRVDRRPEAPPSIISEPCLPGGVQIPPDAQPIILLVEQTVGGYAKIATVVSTDIPRVAQARPQDRVAFSRVELETAHTLHREARQRLDGIRQILGTPAHP